MDWYAVKDGNQIGPISEPRLAEEVGSGALTGATLVWREGLSEWMPLATVQPAWFSSPPVAASAVAAETVEGPVLSAVQTLHHGKIYRCPKSRATLAKMAMLAATVLGALITVIELTGPAATTEEVSIKDMIVGLLALGILVTIVLSVVFFCMWTHRVVANAFALGGRYSQITPGWAVGWYFIPFANLVKPYHALKEAWQSTHEDSKVPGLLPAWWGLWIVSNIIGNISFRLTMNQMTEAALIADLVNLAVDLPLLYCVWQVVTRLTRRQVERAGC